MHSPARSGTVEDMSESTLHKLQNLVVYSLWYGYVRGYEDAADCQVPEAFDEASQLDVTLEGEQFRITIEPRGG